MLRVIVHDRGVYNLERSLSSAARRAPRLFEQAVASSAREGNLIAKRFARETAGSHGKHYPLSFSPEPISGPAGTWAWTYGPVGHPGKRGAPMQGNMSFEWGSRNQKPHMDLNRSADLMHWRFRKRVLDAVDKLLW